MTQSTVNTLPRNSITDNRVSHYFDDDDESSASELKLNISILETPVKVESESALKELAGSLMQPAPVQTLDSYYNPLIIAYFLTLVGLLSMELTRIKKSRRQQPKSSDQKRLQTCPSTLALLN